MYFKNWKIYCSNNNREREITIHAHFTSQQAFASIVAIDFRINDATAERRNDKWLAR